MNKLQLTKNNLAEQIDAYILLLDQADIEYEKLCALMAGSDESFIQDMPKNIVHKTMWSVCKTTIKSIEATDKKSSEVKYANSALQLLYMTAYLSDDVDIPRVLLEELFVRDTSQSNTTDRHQDFTQCISILTDHAMLRPNNQHKIEYYRMNSILKLIIRAYHQQNLKLPKRPKKDNTHVNTEPWLITCIQRMTPSLWNANSVTRPHELNHILLLHANSIIAHMNRQNVEIDLDSTFTNHYMLLAEKVAEVLHDQLQCPETARVICLKALKLMPNNVRMQLLFSQVLLTNKAFAYLVANIESYLANLEEAETNNASIIKLRLHCLMVQALYHMGNLTAAQNHLSQYVLDLVHDNIAASQLIYLQTLRVMGCHAEVAACNAAWQNTRPIDNSEDDQTLIQSQLSAKSTHQTNVFGSINDNTQDIFAKLNEYRNMSRFAEAIAIIMQNLKSLDNTLHDEIKGELLFKMAELYLAWSIQCHDETERKQHLQHAEVSSKKSTLLFAGDEKRRAQYILLCSIMTLNQSWQAMNVYRGSIDEHLCPDIWFVVILLLEYQQLDIALSGIQYLKSEGSLNKINPQQETLLHITAKRGYLKICSALLENGADHQMVDHNGSLAMHLAVKHHHDNMVLRLHEHDLQQKNQQQHQQHQQRLTITVPDPLSDISPLHQAVRSRNISLTRQILLLALDEIDSLINHVNSAGNNVLHYAALSGDEQMCRMLIEFNAVIDSTNLRQQTALHHAAAYGHTAVAEVLLSANADFTLLDIGGMPAFFYAVGRNEKQTFELFINKAELQSDDCLKKLLRLVDSRNQHVLWHLVVANNFKTFKKLMKAYLRLGIDYNTPNIDGINLFDLCQSQLVKNRRCFFKYLLQHSDIIQTHKEEAATILQQALLHKRKIIAKIILNHAESTLSKAQQATLVNTNADAGCSPLLIAAAKDMTRECKLLIQLGADLNSADDDGMTPLHVACIRASLKTVSVLLGNESINITAVDKESNTALILAICNNRPKTAYALIKRAKSRLTPEAFAAFINQVNGENESALWLATWQGMSRVCKLLIKYGAKLDCQNAGGETLLSMSVLRGHSSIVKQLIAHGALNHLQIRGKKRNRLTKRLLQMTSGEMAEETLADALAFYSTILKIAPKSIVYLHNYACYLAVDGQYQQAYTVFREALQLTEAAGTCFEYAYFLIRYRNMLSVEDTSIENDINHYLKCAVNLSQVQEEAQMCYSHLEKSTLDQVLQVILEINDDEPALIDVWFMATWYTALLAHQKYDNNVDEFCNQIFSYIENDGNSSNVNIVTLLLYCVLKAHRAEDSSVTEQFELYQQLENSIDIDISPSQLERVENARTKYQLREDYQISDENALVDLDHHFGSAFNDNQSCSLLFACIAGNYAWVMNILNKMKSLPQTTHREIMSTRETEYHSTPLLIAAENGKVDICNVLINAGAEINAVNVLDQTALHRAAHAGNLQVVLLLLRLGADVTAQDCDGEIPLIAAIKSKSAHAKLLTQCMIQFIVINFSAQAAKNIINMPDHSGHHALYYAICLECEDICEQLIHYGADIQNCDESGNNALSIATSESCESIALRILELFTETHTTSDRHVTCVIQENTLYDAASNGLVLLCEALLQCDVMINSRNSDDSTPLHAACANGHTDVVELLLLNGALLSIVDSAGKTPLAVAVCANQIDVVNTILTIINRQSPDEKLEILNAHSFKDTTLLFTAAVNAMPKMCRCLLGHGADLSITSMVGDSALTPFQGAVVFENHEIAQILLEHHANDHYDQFRRNELFHAILSDDETSVEMIIRYLESAPSHVRIHALLCTDFSGRTVLHHAILRVNHKVVGQLLALGVYTYIAEMRDSNHQSPLHIALTPAYVNEDVINELIQHDAFHLRSHTEAHSTLLISSVKSLFKPLPDGATLSREAQYIHLQQLLDDTTVDEKTSPTTVRKSYTPRHTLWASQNKIPEISVGAGQLSKPATAKPDFSSSFTSKIPIASDGCEGP